ncbi:MAG: hypothetical protein H6751_10555 [Candidatus Omnitrophica bacterium]|nr:hypothetical protein [Candidatus Omnitrophota bacterium]MCB9783390.1 hypothetical protein [Candidatus Omnitrophota bacterium]
MKKKRSLIVVGLLLLLFFAYRIFVPDYAGVSSYKLTILYSADQGSSVSAFSINNSGVVAGRVDRQATVWSSTGEMRSLVKENWKSSSCWKVADNRWMIITAKTIQNEDRIFVWTPDGSLDLVEAPEGREIWLRDINDSGVAVGLIIPATWGTMPNEPVAFPVLIRSPTGETTDLGFVSTTGGDLSINRKGEVAGTRWISKNKFHPDRGVNRACLWSATRGVVDLGTLGGEQSWATGLNDHGEVVGYSKLADGTHYPFIWKGEEMKPLNTPNKNEGGARAINNRGEVIGDYTLGGIQAPKSFRPLEKKFQRWAFEGLGWDYFPGQHRYFLWKDGVSIKVDALHKDKASGHIFIPTDINDQGQIVGSGLFSHQKEEGVFLLTPAQEDHW